MSKRRVTLRNAPGRRKGTTSASSRLKTLVDSYIRWYNDKRIKISLGSLSPIEYRESLGLTA